MFGPWTPSRTPPVTAASTHVLERGPEDRGTKT